MSAARRDIAVRMANAANTFLSSLESNQTPVAAWPFHDTDERERWYYTPTDHGGLALSAMTPPQQRHAHRLVASGLSRSGYVTVASIIGLENVLDELENFTATQNRERGRDPGLYYTRIFGAPGSDEPWSWRFGGHHVSIHHTIIGGEVFASTPNFLGASPANSPLLGPHLLRPLVGAEDLGRELARSLDDTQQELAIVAPVAPLDIVSGNRPHFGLGAGDLPRHLHEIFRDDFSGPHGDGLRLRQAANEHKAGLTPEHLESVRLTTTGRGISAHLLGASQRDNLRAILDTYVRRVPDALADEEAEKYATDDALDGLTFMWAGSTEPGNAHYYRVQGSRLLAEYDNSQNGANHIHTVWRNPHRDFGIDVLGAHYESSHGAGHDDHHDNQSV